MSAETRLFCKDDIRTFDIRDLHGKTLEISVYENGGWLLVIGKDSETGVRYVLKEEQK